MNRASLYDWRLRHAAELVEQVRRRLGIYRRTETRDLRQNCRVIAGEIAAARTGAGAFSASQIWQMVDLLLRGARVRGIEFGDQINSSAARLARACGKGRAA